MKVTISFKVAIVFFLLMLFISGVTLFLIYRDIERIKVEELQVSLRTVAKLAASSIDGNLHSQLPLSPETTDLSGYVALKNHLKDIKEYYPLVRYIYTLVESSTGPVFVVDVGPESELYSLPGDPFDVSRLDKRFNEYSVAEVNTHIFTNASGSFISGFAPIFNKSKEQVGLLGVDMAVEEIEQATFILKKTFLYVIVINLLLSLLLGGIFGRRLTRPVKKLLEGTKELSEGNLDAYVEINNRDEIGELATSFNQMARSLERSYQELKEHFVDSIRSLINALEAKDPYTKGHSLRVGRYSVMIAKEMNVPVDSFESLEAFAAMHDIGKIGVSDDILLKPAALDEEEKKLLRKHPEIGEAILRPIASSDPELLKLIRHHHERPDGKGYPDGLKGDEISILASIVSVADALDAMITNRPYRKGMPIKKAMKELYGEADKQYDARVIDALQRLVDKGKIK